LMPRPEAASLLRWCAPQVARCVRQPGPVVVSSGPADSGKRLRQPGGSDRLDVHRLRRAEQIIGAASAAITYKSNRDPYSAFGVTRPEAAPTNPSPTATVRGLPGRLAGWAQLGFRSLRAL